MSITVELERLRDVRLVRRDDGTPLIYDLERTYLLDLPVGLSSRLTQWPPKSTDLLLRNWLVEQDVITKLPPPNKIESEDAPPPQITDVSIDLPGACNMGCTYCFEKPIKSRIGRMTQTTLEKSVDFAFGAAKGAPKVVFHFGSGEPVIEFSSLQKLVELAKARAEQTNQQVEFELTTNATLITPEIADFFAENPFNIRVSCDGPAETHDRFRPMLNGRNSYAYVERGLRYLLDTMPDRLTVNSVFCSGTRLRDLWAWAKSLGIQHYHAIKVGSEETDNTTLAAQDLADFIEDTQFISNEIFETLKAGERPIDYHPLAKTVRRMLLPQPITRFCGVAGSYVGIASDGKIYPCFRHLGLEDYHLGDIETGINHEKRQSFRQAEAAEVDNRPVCSSCWARYICGGGCYADSVVYGENKLEPQTAHCDFWRAEIEEGIKLYDRLRKTDPLLCLSMFGDDVDAIIEHADARILSQIRTF